jgi:hypothetical protein
MELDAGRVLVSRRRLGLWATGLLAFTPLAGQAALRQVDADTADANVDRLFVDTRFELARQFTAQTVHPSQCVARAEVAALWYGELSAYAESSFVFAGITTESFAFCLNQLANECSATAFASQRVGRDLHLWTIHTR